VVTASPESFRLPSDKVTVTGHGVDTDLFDQPAAPPADGRPFRLVAVGRISRIKDHETLVRAVAVLSRRDPQTTWEVQIVGAPLYADDAAYLAELQRLAGDLNVAGQIDFGGSIPNRALPPAYGAADVAVSTSRTGSLDKVVLEGMACRRPVVTCNEAFQPILGSIDPPLLFPAGDAEALAERILGLRQSSTEARSALGERLRGIVMRDHSVDQWADRTVAVCATLAGSAAGASGRLAAQFDGNTPVSSAQPSRPR
jgi:glycosyltransferase involved in cell wall biosynthesis